MTDKHAAIMSVNAKNLRRNMTPEERHLWYDYLKSLPKGFKRQKVIGPYIVDFYCASAKLVIEVDGSQHYDEQGLEADELRDAYLRAKGLAVLRYSNYDVKHNFESVCEDIEKYL